MKKTYSTPKLNVHGSIETLTQSQSGSKTFGLDDGMFMAITGNATVGS